MGSYSIFVAKRRDFIKNSELESPTLHVQAIGKWHLSYAKLEKYSSLERSTVTKNLCHVKIVLLASTYSHK
jgi:hypothetical protein